MDRTTLVLLSDLNYAEANRELTRRAGGTVLDEEGLVCWAGAHPRPVLVNGCMRTTDALAPADVLARARRFFAPRRRGFSVVLRGDRDADLAPACDEAGMARMDDTRGMVLARRLPDAAPPGVTLRRVATPADVAAFARVNGEAYATYGMPPDCAPALFARPETVLAPHVVAVLAYVGDAPASAAMAILTHGIAGIYWVGTTPAARSQGLAELCTRTVGNAAFDAGARVVVLQASTMGEPIYTKMGYEAVTRYPCYVAFSTPDA